MAKAVNEDRIKRLRDFVFTKYEGANQLTVEDCAEIDKKLASLIKKKVTAKEDKAKE